MHKVVHCKIVYNSKKVKCNYPSRGKWVINFRLFIKYLVALKMNELHCKNRLNEKIKEEKNMGRMIFI